MAKNIVCELFNPHMYSFIMYEFCAIKYFAMPNNSSNHACLCCRLGENLLMIYIFCTYIYWCLRPMFKWIIRKSTGKCELLRITFTQSQKYERSSKIGEYYIIRAHTHSLLVYFRFSSGTPPYMTTLLQLSNYVHMSQQIVSCGLAVFFARYGPVTIIPRSHYLGLLGLGTWVDPAQLLEPYYIIQVTFAVISLWLAIETD